MTDDPGTERPGSLVEVVVAGHRRDVPTARRALASADARVRSAALGALGRSGVLLPGEVAAAAADPSAAVRRRACELAGRFPGGDAAAGHSAAGQQAAGQQAAGTALDVALRLALADDDALVVEAACWALGERGAVGVVDGLADVARSHPDTRARESAIAALGAIGDPAGLPVVLGGLDDRPTVRRRAVVALAAFDGDEVVAALRRAAGDRDWQVREVAAILRDDQGLQEDQAE